MIKLTDFKFFANTDGELYVSVADLKKRLKEEYRIKTNYDRIRNMSVEGMAVLIADEIPHGDCYGCDKCHYRESPYRLHDACQDGWLKWLESEVEE